jgi:hypothetical protein
MIICVKCELQYQPVKIGAAVQTMTEDGPYQLFSADRLECPGCGHAIARSAADPIAEHFQGQVFRDWADGYAQRGELMRSWATLKEKEAAQTIDPSAFEGIGRYRSREDAERARRKL